MLKLEIVTPERRVVDAEVDAVTVPTATGEVGLLASHAPLVSSVFPGVLSYTVRGVPERLVVSAGFLEVSNDKVSVLVDSAETADEIDPEAARREREEAERHLAANATAPVEDTEQTREQLDHAAARLSLATSRSQK